MWLSKTPQSWQGILAGQHSFESDEGSVLLWENFEKEWNGVLSRDKDVFETALQMGYEVVEAAKLQSEWCRREGKSRMKTNSPKWKELSKLVSEYCWECSLLSATESNEKDPSFRNRFAHDSVLMFRPTTVSSAFPANCFPAGAVVLPPGQHHITLYEVNLGDVKVTEGMDCNTYLNITTNQYEVLDPTRYVARFGCLIEVYNRITPPDIQPSRDEIRKVCSDAVELASALQAAKFEIDNHLRNYDSTFAATEEVRTRLDREIHILYKSAKKQISQDTHAVGRVSAKPLPTCIHIDLP